MYDSIAGLLHIKGDILDGMTTNEFEKTKQAIAQINNNNTTPDDAVRQKNCSKMEYQIIWSNTAESDFDEIIEYISTKQSPEKAIDFVKAIYWN